MLILTRRPGETIRIGDQIEVTVLSISKGQVRIGIAAPRDVAVHREEIYQRIQANPEQTPTPTPRRSSFDDPSVDRRANFTSRRPSRG